MAAVREAPSGHFAHYCIERCDRTSPIRQILSSCEAASRTADGPDCRTAAALAEMFLAAIVSNASCWR